MNATVIVRYDSSAHEETEPRLRATVDDRGVPHATFEAFRAFVYEWHAIDPNGTWEPEGVHLDAGSSSTPTRWASAAGTRTAPARTP